MLVWVLLGLGFWVLGFCSCSVVLGFASLCFGVLILWVVFVVLVDLVVDYAVVCLAGWCSLAAFRFGCGRSFCVGSRNIEFCFGGDGFVDWRFGGGFCGFGCFSRFGFSDSGGFCG